MKLVLGGEACPLLLMMLFEKILLGVESRVIPAVCLLQSAKFLFVGNVIIL